ncbi:MAG: DUF3267 domain-containing protein [Candidatus Azobacteroides sp.]|nr:DUF3267 domain-containing protein [Candidatus Azobacteroides sp.]
MKKIECILPEKEVNRWIFFITIIVILAAVLPYMLMYRESLRQIIDYRTEVQEAVGVFRKFWLCILPVLILMSAICVHEAIHGLCFAFFCKDHFKSIKFGFKLPGFYTYCKEPLKRNQFIISGLMPAILLGLIPLIYAFIFSNARIWLFGFIMLTGGGGDFIIVYHIMKKAGSDDRILEKMDCFMGFEVEKS